MAQQQQTQDTTCASPSAGDRAAAAFRTPPHHLNCAQAVAHAWAEGDASILADHGCHGGGNAPGGECGALYAARCAAARSGGDADALGRQFTAIHGATTCRDLRARRIACSACVRTAADLVATTRR